MRRAALLALVVLVATGSLVVLSPPPVAGAGQISEYMTGLAWPIALAFSLDGRIFFAERLTGNIRIIEGGFLQPTPFYTLTDTATGGERGFLGLALDPGFPAAPYVYAYQTYDDASNGTVYNRIVRIFGNGTTGVSHAVILRMPPLSAATNHNGGVIAFGPDGKLYALVGENANPSLSQNPTSPMGKVLRMNPDGSAPSDNPFIGNATWNDLVYTYGHRNMFGLAFHPATDQAYVTENGPSCNDEVSILSPGGNFGWGSTATCSSPPAPPGNTNRDGPNPVPPIWWWANTICPTNAAIYAGPYFPMWQGDLFMGDCNFRRLHRIDLSPPAYDAVASDTILWTAPSAILDVEVGPDGAIWVTTPSTIYRYWDSGEPPVATFTATPSPATVGTPVSFDASASTDPDGTIVAYAWDFGDSTTGSGVTTLHAYTSPGTFRTMLTVTDNESFTATSSQDIVVQAPPSPEPPRILSSDPGLGPVTIVAGTTRTFIVSASDPNGDALTYTWRVNGTLAGGNAPGFNFTGSTVGTFTVNVTVSDGSLEASREWTVSVVPPIGVPQWNPWPLLFAAILGASLATAMGLILWQGRRRRASERPPPPGSA